MANRSGRKRPRHGEDGDNDTKRSPPKRPSGKRRSRQNDDEDVEWSPSSRRSSRRSFTYVEVEPESLRKSLRLQIRAARASLQSEPLMIIDLTDEGDEEQSASAGEENVPQVTYSDLLQKFEQDCAEMRHKKLEERPVAPYLDKMSGDECEIAKELVTKICESAQVASIENPTGGRITLKGRDFKLLRGSRWLNDEVINAYMGLINQRNNDIFDQMSARLRKDIPRTYAFNTFFYACLSRNGYDYSCVARWTKRAKVDILGFDLLLIPVNLSNTHWVLTAIDLSKKSFLYLDSMHGNDYKGILNVLKRWLEDETRDKYGEETASQLQIEKWSMRCNQYVIKRVGVLPKSIEPFKGAKNRPAQVPRQNDSGSCGVFTAKAADCLSLGIKMYYLQKDIVLVRHRMALDLFSGFLPC